MTVKEPAALVLTNVLWHLHTGASAVFVFFDDPHDPAVNVVQAVPGCNVQVCDQMYWRKRRPNHGRPHMQMRRQTINANVAHNRCALDWLFHVDADEFIWQDGDFAGELEAHQNPEVELNIPVLERIFPKAGQANLFDGLFRVTSDLKEEAARDAFGLFTGFMKRGQYSHGAGKSGIRVGGGLRLGVHNATVPGREKWNRAPKQISRTARLLHFDGITPLHGILKILRHLRTPPNARNTIPQAHRQAQVDWMLERSETVTDGVAAHHMLFALTEDRQARLQRHGLLCKVPFDPASTIGAEAPDLSPSEFDADVVRRYPWLRNLIEA
ncbi:glycosyltransferase family 2 protein [Tateyamaria omphalii]|uniref:glycosyltransferase family 2 protein n=1 Tax=Tateyamaria omphalii TaxID=299262 RepID=UPI00167B62D3|nr:glycosyltransferase family 2 protein [Tateyamaria omphalii]